MRANETYSEAKGQFTARNKNVLMNAQSPHKWWSTLKSTVFGLSLSLPLLVVVVVVLPQPVWPSRPAPGLPIKGNKLLGSLGYRNNPQGVLLQADWLRAEGEVGAIWPDSVRIWGASTTERCFR